MTDRRRPEAEEGTEPDYRFTLANERTFLAWIRTGISLLAAGVAVRQLVPSFQVPHARELLAVACTLLAVVISAGAYPRWRKVQRALSRQAPLPPSRTTAVLAGVLCTVGVFTTVLVWVGGTG
ncbi:YidH family protein [Streptomyces sp. NPDC059850]|uniref:YidH family protein n=1 Tax=Streptomyces sp. NPDC059850 TaxID=3346970 RepID=UPI003669B9FB